MGSPIKGWLILGVVAVLCGCETRPETVASARRDLDNQDTTIRELSRRNEELSGQLRVLETELEALRAENASMRRGKAAVDQISDLAQWLKQLEDKLGRDFTVKQRPDGLAIEVAETVLFEVGKASLRPEGKRILLDLVSKLGSFQGDIRVEGHTDNQPVVIHRNEFPLGNLQLSGIRALNVNHFLVTDGGLAANRVSFAGYGEHHPVAENSSPTDKARNRRVEIVLLKPEASRPR